LDLLSAIKKAKGDHVLKPIKPLENRAGMEEAVSDLITQPALDAKRKTAVVAIKTAMTDLISSTHVSISTKYRHHRLIQYPNSSP
jgi:hypothetical protein